MAKKKPAATAAKKDDDKPSTPRLQSTTPERLKGEAKRLRSVALELEGLAIALAEMPESTTKVEGYKNLERGHALIELWLGNVRKKVPRRK